MSEVSRWLIKGQKARALRVLDDVMAEDLPLFRDIDPSADEERRLAWLYRIELLREWGRWFEALAWTCLECEMHPENVAAQAIKEHLKTIVNLKPSSRQSLVQKATMKLTRHWHGVAGMREIKAILERDVILPLEQPELYARYKIDLPNGVLFYGPPGCGKTFIARKLADFLRFNFIEIKPSDLASIYVHGGQEKIGELFKNARENAPSLLFFDELDALVPNRGGHSVGHHYMAEVNEFLVQLNECRKSNLLVIGATNLIDNVDPAVRRPGRLDKKIFIGPPDLEARVELLQLYMEGRPTGRIDWLHLAEESDLYTSAEISELVNEAARIALTERRDIETKDFHLAMKVVTPSLTAEMVRSMRAACN